jgi:hypothetical protein
VLHSSKEKKNANGNKDLKTKKRGKWELTTIKEKVVVN